MNSFGPVVVSLGEVLWDRFPDGDRLGGAPANFAFHAAQFGARAKLVSRVGLDSDGDRLLLALGEHGVDKKFLQKDAQHKTGLVRVKVTDGRPVYDIVRPAAWDFLNWTGEVAALAKAAAAVVFGTLAQRNEKSRITIQRFVRAVPLGAFCLFDLKLRENFYNRGIVEFGLDNATLLKVNVEELGILAEMFHWGGAHEEQVVQLLLKNHALTGIVVTHGENACHLYYDGEMVRSAAPAIEVRDKVGAGDALAAALVMGLLRKEPLQVVADRATEISAYVASQPGGMLRLPASALMK
jgi:fructokinase